MIVVDPLFSTAPFTNASTPRCFRNTRAAHMMSTSPGDKGFRELVSFARRLGLKPSWIQYPGTRRQHLDLTEGKRRLAVALGAGEVSRGWQLGDPIDIED